MTVRGWVRATGGKALLAGGLWAFAATASAAGGTLAVKCGRLIDGVTAEVRTAQVVVVRDGKIVSVGGEAAPEGMPVLDLAGHTCLPGLLDLHTHITDVPVNTADFRIYARRPRAEHLRLARDNARATLEAGFTAVRDLGTYVGWLDRDLRDEINAGKIPGPRMQVSGFYITVAGGGGDMQLPGFPKREIRTPLKELRLGVARGPAEFRARAQAAVDGGADVLKIIASGAVLALGGVPGSPEMTPAEIAAVVEVAHANGRKVAAHAHGAQSVREAILAGADTIEHASLVDDEGLRLALQHGTVLDMDVYNGDYIDTEGRAQGWPAEFLQKNIDTTEVQRVAFTKAVALGVALSYGTDAGVFPHGLNARQFRFMVARGMTPMQAIQSATSVSARAIGWEDRVGSLQAGRYGDLIAVRGDPLEDITVLERVDAVVKGGEVVKAPPAAP